MSDDEDALGISQWEEIKRRRGKRTVYCLVSERYLRFAVASPQAGREGHPLAIDVMVNRHGEGKDRKFCELVPPIEAMVLANLVASPMLRSTSRRRGR